MSDHTDDPQSEFIRELTRVQQDVAAFVRALLPHHLDHMDILQEVNVTLWKKQQDFRPGSNFKAWAFTVARYHVMSARRRFAAEGKRLVFDDELVDLLSQAAPTDDEPFEIQLEALRSCLEGLREQDRALLRMRYSPGVSIEEFSRTQKRNAGTVRATLRRLRGILLKCVERRIEADYPAPGANRTWEL